MNQLTRSILAITALLSAAPVWPDCAPLVFTRDREYERNAFYRASDVAAHLALSGGRTPRVVVAFPAGNSSTALLFKPVAGALEWEQTSILTPVRTTNADGAALRGVSAEVRAYGGGMLDVERAVLGNVRVLRDVLGGAALPSAFVATMSIGKNSVTWQRRRIDGKPGYRLSVEAPGGRVEPLGDGRVRLLGDSSDRLSLRITALSGDEPLKGICADRLFRPEAGNDPALRDALTFLSYEDKLLAGSWRYNTYFGRDTLLVLQMLRDVLQPHPIEAGLRSVLDRLSASGEVAHEESVGEFAAYQRRAAGSAGDEPVLDYNMVDEDFLLAPVLASYLLDDAVGRHRASALLASKSSSGETYGARLVRNLRFVISRTRSFADEPRPANLIALKPGQVAGNWRDSRDGLGGGRYPYDVNAVLAPAALDAARRLVASGLVDDYKGRDLDASQIARAHAIWAAHSAAPFLVHIAQEDAKRGVAEYARRLGVDARAAIGTLPPEGVEFPAIALDAKAAPIPVLHTDPAMAMLFGAPTERDLSRSTAAMARPFPAGLAMPMGLVSANAVYASPKIRELFGPEAYAGAVVTSWQQALLVIGLSRQSQRASLSPTTKVLVHDALRGMRTRIGSTTALRSDELWSWSFIDGHYVARRYGNSIADETEANPIQLWSTAYLSVKLQAGEDEP